MSLRPIVLQKRYLPSSIGVLAQGAYSMAKGSGVKTSIGAHPRISDPYSPKKHHQDRANGLRGVNLPLAAGAIDLRRNAFTRTPGPSRAASAVSIRAVSAVWSAT